MIAHRSDNVCDLLPWAAENPSWSGPTQILEALAYEIHRAGGPTPEEKAWARDLLERRGQLSRVKEINERLERNKPRDQQERAA